MVLAIKIACRRIFSKKKKHIKIRRKNIFFIEPFVKIQPQHEIKSLSINEFIWGSTIFNNDNKQKVSLNTVYTYAEILHTQLKLNTLGYIKKNPLLYLYSTYCRQYLISKKKPIIFTELNFVTVSIPKTQVFFTICKKTPILIFTCGVIRIVMKLPEKSSKKKNIVLLNSIKFMWQSVKINKMKSFYLIFKKNFTIIKKIFQKYMKESTGVEYILYYPTINFGFSNFKKRSSVKKKLQKTRKYRAD